MAKSKSLKNRAKGLIRSSRKNIEYVLPFMKTNFSNARSIAKGVAKETIPVVEKGVEKVYGTMSTGFNLGIKGAKNVATGIKSVVTKRRKSRSRKSRRRR